MAGLDGCLQGHVEDADGAGLVDLGRTDSIAQNNLARTGPELVDLDSGRVGEAAGRRGGRAVVGEEVPVGVDTAVAAVERLEGERPEERRRLRVSAARSCGWSSGQRKERERTVFFSLGGGNSP